MIIHFHFYVPKVQIGEQNTQQKNKKENNRADIRLSAKILSVLP